MRLSGWVPPVLVNRLKSLLRRGIYYSGQYASWSLARSLASGYNAAHILEKVKAAALKIKAGEAACERDSVIFDRIEHSFPVLAGLLRAAMENGARLSVLDFGGSLGSSYYQCRAFLAVVEMLRWNIVEQEHYVRCGRECFETEQLRFHYTIAECVKSAEPNVALLSSVLQYVPEPEAVIAELMQSGMRYLIFDRTPFSDLEIDRITIQHVPPTIYPASYPCWIFAKSRFLETFRGRYELVAQFNCADGSAYASGLEFSYYGMILRKI